MSRRALLLFAVLALGCGPEKTYGSGAVIRPSIAGDSPDEAFGAQIKITTDDFRLLGELIACDEAYAYVRVNSKSEIWIMVPWLEIHDARLRLRGSGGPTAIAMVVSSVAGTASQGVLALYTAPSLGAAGVGTIIGAYAADVVSGRCNDLRAYARYPAGLPSTLRVGWLAPRSAPALRPVVAPLPAPPQPPAPGTTAPIVPPAPPPAPPADAADAGAANPADAGAAPASDAPDAAAPSP